MKELNAPDKIVQQMTRDGAVELNKATGSAERISDREPETSVTEDALNTGGDGIAAVGGVADRVLAERRAFKKKVVRKENAKIFKRSQQKPETSRLQFSEAERGDPSLAKSIRKSDKAADRVEAARAKIPKEKIVTIERVQKKSEGRWNTVNNRKPSSRRVLDEPTGKTETRLSFRERDKPPNGKLTHALDRPTREIGLAFHSEVRKREGDNTGIEAAHFTEQTAEGAARKIGQGYDYLKSQPYRAAAVAEDKAVKANVNALYERRKKFDPELEHANPIQKIMQKRKIKREYAKSFREGQKTADLAKQTANTLKETAQKVKETVQKTVKFVATHWKGIAIFGIGLLLLVILLAGFSSCMSLFGGGFNAVIGTSYTAEDADISGVEADYAALESQLAARIASIESDYGGYDEYRYSLDEIGHDPFVLASYLTAKFYGYTQAEVQAELAALFAQQYELTLNPVTETRYRTETYSGSITYTDPETGENYTEDYSYEVEVPYNYYILNVTLTNRDLGGVAIANLTPEQAEMYAVYMQTRGNKPELFAGNPYASQNAFIVYGVPPEALTDTVFAAMLQEAEKYLGYPYVWGGSSPSTSFDCSGYVSWVINHSGWSFGRLTAKGLFNVCTPVSPADAKPGDLIFFWKTYAAPDPNGATHVGIYVGGGYMLHCGNPISYADITTPYWVSHFYSFGRLP